MALPINRPGLGLGLLLMLGAFAWGLWRWAQPEDYANLPPTATGPWVAFGDSLTQGYGASPGQDYPTVLSRRLGIPIRNMGRSGDTTEDGLQRLDEVVALNPRVVLLCLGGNDGLQGRSGEQMRANLAILIDRLHERGAFVVLLGVRSASLRDRNARLFRQLAREKRLLHVPDILQGVFARPIYMADALHPNDEGYRRIAERLERELRPWLPKLQVGAGP